MGQMAMHCKLSNAIRQPAGRAGSLSALDCAAAPAGASTRLALRCSAGRGADGQVQGVNNLLHTFLAPIVGSLSDSVGRRNLHAIGRVGPMLWCECRDRPAHRIISGDFCAPAPNWC